MLNVSSGQLSTFLFSVLIGLGMGLLTLILNLIPTFSKHKILRVAMQTIFDFISPIIFMLSIFIASLLFNYGITRWFIILAISLGYFIIFKIGNKVKALILRVAKNKQGDLNFISDKKI